MVKLKRRFPWAQAPLAALVIAELALMPECNRKPISGGEVWAEVEGRPIYRDKVERLYRSRVPEGSDAGSSAQALNLKLNILNEIINNQILADHASHARITVAETEVDTKLSQIQAPFT